jgi:hypothetical protein
MSLITLSEAKNYLGISAADTSFNSFLTQQISVVSEAIEAYCRRKFAQATYTQTYSFEDYGYSPDELPLFMYPLVSITSITEDGIDLADYKANLPTGVIVNKGGFFTTGHELEVVYVAGYATIPALVKQVCYNVVEERYNKKKSGVSLNFGSDVQRISIPGTISIDFDYTLTQNERSNSFGSILGNNLNVLDFFRSERIVSGSGKLIYVS